MSTDLPEGVIDADPPGGFADGAAADGETAQRNADAADSPLLSESRLAPNGPDRSDAAGTPPAPVEPDVPVESDAPSHVGDADLATDDETEQS